MKISIRSVFGKTKPGKSLSNDEGRTHDAVSDEDSNEIVNKDTSELMVSSSNASESGVLAKSASMQSLGSLTSPIKPKSSVKMGSDRNNNSSIGNNLNHNSHTTLTTVGTSISSPYSTASRNIQFSGSLSTFGSERVLSSSQNPLFSRSPSDRTGQGSMYRRRSSSSIEDEEQPETKQREGSSPESIRKLPLDVNLTGLKRFSSLPNMDVNDVTGSSNSSSSSSTREGLGRSNPSLGSVDKVDPPSKNQQRRRTTKLSRWKNMDEANEKTKSSRVSANAAPMSQSRSRAAPSAHSPEARPSGKQATDEATPKSSGRSSSSTARDPRSEAEASRKPVPKSTAQKETGKVEATGSKVSLSPNQASNLNVSQQQQQQQERHPLIPLDQAKKSIALTRRQSSTVSQSEDPVVAGIENLAEEMTAFFSLMQNPLSPLVQVKERVQSTRASLSEQEQREMDRLRQLEDEEEKQLQEEQQDNEGLRSQVAALQRRLEEMEQDRDSLESTLQRQATTYRHALSEAQQEQEVQQEVTKHQESLREETERYKAEAQAAKKDLQDSQESVLRLTQSNKKSLEDANLHIQTLGLEIEEWQTKYNKLQERTQQEIQTLNTELALLSKDRLTSESSLRREMDYIQNRASETTLRLKDARHRNQELEEEMKGLRRTVRELQNAQGSNRDENERGSNDLLVMTKHVNVYKAELEVVHRELTEAVSRVEILEQLRAREESSAVGLDADESIAETASLSLEPVKLQMGDGDGKSLETDLIAERVKSMNRSFKELDTLREANKNLEHSLNRELQLSTDRSKAEEELAFCKRELERTRNERDEERARAQILAQQAREMSHSIQVLDEEKDRSGLTGGTYASGESEDGASFSVFSNSMTGESLLQSIKERRPSLGASLEESADASSSVFSYSFNGESMLQSKLDELELKISTAAGVLKYERAEFKKQSETFGNALQEARHGRDHLEQDIEEARAMIAELQEKRRQEHQVFEEQLEELTLKSRSVTSSMQEEIEHWREEAYSARDALEEAEVRSRLMKKEFDSLQASKWALEELRTKEKKELENAMEGLRESQEARVRQLEEELEAAGVELELSRNALELATTQLETIQEESQERIDELEAELEESRNADRDRGEGSRQLRTKLAQQLRQSNDRVEVYGKELEKAKDSELKSRKELKDAKKRIAFLEAYVEDSRAAIQDMKRCDRIEREGMEASFSQLEEEFDATKARLEKELKSARLEARRAQQKIDASLGYTESMHTDSAEAAVEDASDLEDASVESEMMESYHWRLDVPEPVPEPVLESGDSVDTDVYETDAWKTDTDDSDVLSDKSDDDSRGKLIVPKTFVQLRGSSVEILKAG